MASITGGSIQGKLKTNATKPSSRATRPAQRRPHRPLRPAHIMRRDPPTSASGPTDPHLLRTDVPTSSPGPACPHLLRTGVPTSAPRPAHVGPRTHGRDLLVPRHHLLEPDARGALRPHRASRPVHASGTHTGAAWQKGLVLVSTRRSKEWRTHLAWSLEPGLPGERKPMARW